MSNLYSRVSWIQNGILLTIYPAFTTRPYFLSPLMLLSPRLSLFPTHNATLHYFATYSIWLENERKYTIICVVSLHHHVSKNKAALHLSKEESCFKCDAFPLAAFSPPLFFSLDGFLHSQAPFLAENFQSCQSDRRAELFSSSQGKKGSFCP